MAYCVKCGTALAANAQFCGACGTSLDDPAFAPYRPGAVATPVARTNGLAITSLVLSIALCGLGSVIAIILGFVARKQIDRSAGLEKGKGLATAGIIVGFIGPVLLVAVAVPTFIGARNKIREREAQDRAAQSSLRNAVTSAKVIFTDHEDYRDATPAALGHAEPTLAFTAPGVDSTSQTTISAGAAGPTTFFAAARSASGTCWYVRDVVGSGADAGTRWNDARFLNSCRASVVPSTPWTPVPGRSF